MPLSFPNIGNAAEFVGQALGPRRPLRPPRRAFNNLGWVFDRARVPLDPLSRSKSQSFRQPRQADEASACRGCRKLWLFERESGSRGTRARSKTHPKLLKARRGGLRGRRGPRACPTNSAALPILGKLS